MQSWKGANISDNPDHLLMKWVSLSQVQQQTLNALAHEVDVAGQLVETSMNAISDHFMQVAQLASLQSRILEKEVCAPQDHDRLKEISTELCEKIHLLVTQMQFQDRTQQRLDLIGTTLNVLGRMMQELSHNTEPDSGKTLLPEDKEWLEETISRMHLGEIRERFVRHALFDGTQDLFDHSLDQRKEVDHATSSDDIELF